MYHFINIINTLTSRSV